MRLSLTVAFILALVPCSLRAEPSSVVLDRLLVPDWDGSGDEGSGTPVSTDGCQRLEGGQACSDTGCPTGFKCLAAPDDKCACIKPCGKGSFGRCEGGCAPGKVCDNSGRKCECVEPTKTCTLKSFPTPADPQGKACGGECPPGFVCVPGTKEAPCTCVKPTTDQGTCKFVANNGDPYCEGNCPSGKGKCYPIINDDTGAWTECKCQETCKKDVSEAAECKDGVCLYGAVCNYKDADSSCDCNPIIPTPTPTPGGEADCGIKVSGAGSTEWQEEDSITELEAKLLRASGFTVTCEIKGGQCPATRRCAFSSSTYGECACR